MTLSKEGKKREFTKIESDFVTLEIGESVEGVLQGRTQQEFTTSTVGKYTIMPDGAEKSVTILGATDLDAKMMNIRDGAYVRITYTGTARTRTGQNMKQYIVEVAK